MQLSFLHLLMFQWLLNDLERVWAGASDMVRLIYGRRIVSLQKRNDVYVVITRTCVRLLTSVNAIVVYVSLLASLRVYCFSEHWKCVFWTCDAVTQAYKISLVNLAKFFLFGLTFPIAIRNMFFTNLGIFLCLLSVGSNMSLLI